MTHERDEYSSRLTSDAHEYALGQPHFSSEAANSTIGEVDIDENSSAEAAREERISGAMSTAAIIDSFGEPPSSFVHVGAVESERAYDSQPRFQGDTTDPTQHDSTSFRYLVHSLNPYAALNILYMLSSVGASADPSHGDGDQSINMYEQPERVAERISLSMSLIDQDHTATWGHGGLIISAPEENIVLTSRTDADAHNNDKNFLLEQSARHGVMSAEQLLATTSPRQYNEVVALADNDGSKLETIGFFYKVTSKGEPVDLVIAQQMRMHAERLGLPVVEILQENKLGEDRVDRSTDDDQKVLAIVYGGERYLLSNSYYRILDEASSFRFASPEEVSAALQFAVNANNMTEAEAQQILDDYAEVRERRMTPTAYYDDEGNFEKIVYYEGYGDDELRVTLDNSGYIRRVNTKRESEKRKRAMLGGFVRRDTQNCSIPARPHKADSMVKRAKEGLDEAKADELQQWYDRCREAIEQNWSVYVQKRCKKKAVKSDPKTITSIEKLFR
jgi:hypothetical protein